MGDSALLRQASSDSYHVLVVTLLSLLLRETQFLRDLTVGEVVCELGEFTHRD